MVLRKFISHETLMEVHAAWSAFMTFYLSLAGGLSYADLLPHKTSSFLLILGAALSGGGAAFFSKLGIDAQPPQSTDTPPEPARLG